MRSRTLWVLNIEVVEGFDKACAIYTLIPLVSAWIDDQTSHSVDGFHVEQDSSPALVDVDHFNLDRDGNVEVRVDPVVRDRDRLVEQRSDQQLFVTSVGAVHPGREISRTEELHVSFSTSNYCDNVYTHL